LSRYTGRAQEHEVLIDCIAMMLSWMWDLPIDLYPCSPPSVQIRGKPANNQPLKQGYIATLISTATRYTRSIPLAERSLNPTEKDDIFALGTVLYEISVGHQLYAEKSDCEVYKLFQKQEFPDTMRLIGSLETVIEKC
jgi:hypothetical protein